MSDLSNFYLSSDLISEPFLDTFKLTKIFGMTIPRTSTRSRVAMAEGKVKFYFKSLIIDEF